MRVLLNIIWLIFGGVLLALGYAIAGIICFILIITIPFGIRVLPDGELRAVAVRPHDLAPKPSAGVASGIGNVIWFIVAGWWLALGHIVTAIAQFITIIGIPLGIANIKMVPVSLFPLGHEIVPGRNR